MGYIVNRNTYIFDKILCGISTLTFVKHWIYNSRISQLYSYLHKVIILSTEEYVSKYI